MAKIGASYFDTMARALPGQVSDTSAYNIDGACVLDKEDGIPILVGVAVKLKGVDSMGNKLIDAISGGGDVPYGVGIRSHFQTTADNGRMVYEVGSGINVMTEGRVWMIGDDSDKNKKPSHREPVKIDENTGKVKSGGAINTNWIYTGDKTTFGNGEDVLTLFEVQVFPS